MSYQPRGDSLAARLCAFFKANPEEELDTGDIAKKYDVHSKQVPSLLTSALAHGFILRVGPGSYKAGDKLLQAGDAPPPQTSGFKGWLARQGLDEAKGRDAGAALPAPASLVIEAGVPIPEPQSNRVLQYASTFAAMNVGDSFAVPVDASKALITCASRWGKGIGRRFVMRRTTATEARIWRKE